MTDDSTPDILNRLSRRLLAVLDENADLRALVCDMAANLPLTEDQQRIVKAAFDGEWTR